MIALIEARLGIDNVDAIAAVDGVDCLYLGHVSQSVDLGVPGVDDHDCLMQRIAPRYAEAMENRSFGILVRPAGWKKWCGSGLEL